MFGRLIQFGALFGALMLPSLAMAQSYVPDVLVLNGTSTLEIPADDRLLMEGGSTIEFWVQPDWKEDPGYDPVVLSNAGSEGPSYLVALLRNKDGIGVMAGDRSAIAAFDFSDGKLHHVAIVDDGISIAVLVNNRPITKVDFGFRKLPSAGFWIGSADGENAPFKGAIAGLRLWDIALAPEVIGAFGLADITDDEKPAHPDLQWLIGRSDFANLDFILQDYEE